MTVPPIKIQQPSAFAVSSPLVEPPETPTPEAVDPDSSAVAWTKVILKILGVLTTLYVFLFALGLMGDAFKILTGREAGTLFSDISNPFAGLMVGVLATVALQSSSTTTSIVVSLVGSGAMSVHTAVPVIMGANIGTSVTNTIVSLGQMQEAVDFSRAFAGATVHDCFNILTVAVMLPLEAVTGVLEKSSGALVGNLGTANTFKSPLKVIIDPLVALVVTLDKSKLKKATQGKPVTGSLLKSSMFGDMSDGVIGTICLTVSLVILVIALLVLVKVLQSLVLKSGKGQRWLKKAANMNGYMAMLIGCGVTMLVQSSSVTTSTITPLVGLGMITLEAMLPLTLGANIGTTFTALLAAMASDDLSALQIALCHLFFNVAGILIWYPVPKMRQAPLNMARWLGKAVTLVKSFAFIYLAATFFVVPALLLVAAELLVAGGSDVAGGIALIIVTILFLLAVYVWIELKAREHPFFGEGLARRRSYRAPGAFDVELAVVPKPDVFETSATAAAIVTPSHIRQ